MARDTMRAIQCTGPNRLELLHVATPEPAPGEARVRVTACGICGSDLHLLPVAYGSQCLVPGHEMTGVVDALGDGVGSISTGDTVVVEPLRSCESCRPCRRGQPANCERSRIFGIHEDGGLADFVCVPAHRLYPISERLPPQIAALAEPLAVAVHGLDRGGVDDATTVLVLGAGTVGLLATFAASERGATVWTSARYPQQAELASALGATRVLGRSETTSEGLAALRGEVDFDCVVESVGGHADTLALAVAALAPGGTISVLGMFTAPQELQPLPLLLKEVTLAWSNCYQRGEAPADFAESVRLVEAHADRLAPLTTHQVPLEEAAAGFALAGDRAAGTVKVSVLP